MYIFSIASDCSVAVGNPVLVLLGMREVVVLEASVVEPLLVPMESSVLD